MFERNLSGDVIVYTTEMDLMNEVPKVFGSVSAGAEGKAIVGDHVSDDVYDKIQDGSCSFSQARHACCESKCGNLVRMSRRSISPDLTT